MSQQSENLDFSGLFKLDVLVHLDISTHSFYELGLKRFLSFSSDKELIFLYINPQGERFEKNYDWDFLDNPVYCMCFEPSGTWVVIVSEQKVLLVPFLPLFIPQNTFDCKWSLSSVSVLPLGTVPRPTSVVLWLTKDSENILIIGSKNGIITFYSLESQSGVGECKVPGEITDLQICFDDSLDLLTLLISGTKYQQWKLVLEHRSVGYNWLVQTRNQTEGNKKDGFMSYIKQLSKDKITLFIQGGSKGKGKNREETCTSADVYEGRVAHVRRCKSKSLHVTTGDAKCNTRQPPSIPWIARLIVPRDKRKRLMYFYGHTREKEFLIPFVCFTEQNDSKATVEYVLKPTEYLPLFRKGSNNWALTAQYVNGRHFLTAFELNEGTLILESPEEDSPSRTLRPHIKKDGSYIQGLWSQRLVYLLRKNNLEVHSSNFSIIQGDGLLGAKREFSEIWSAETIGDIRRAYLTSAKEPPSLMGGWKEPTFMCDLQLPRFHLAPCLLITTSGAYMLNTVCEPCEWLVGLIMRGGAGAELSAAALGAPVPTLLRAAADMLLSRGKLAPAQYLYSLSQSQADGWVARLGVFGRLQELSTYKQTGSIGSLGNAAITIKLLASLLKMCTKDEGKIEMDVKFTTLSTVELTELSSVSAAIGLWDLLPVFSLHRGHPSLMLTAIKARNAICRGALSTLLTHSCLVPLLLEENALWLFHFIADKCTIFDTDVLKSLCLWLNPLQDQLRPVMRDLKQGIMSVCTARMLQLITTFIHVASAIEAREPCPEIHLEVTQSPETWKNQFVPRRALSCGLAHWAVVDDGNAKIMMTHTPVNTELIGRVIDVACGRHHTLVLTENGIYSAGDNSYGQLGVGDAWAGAIGDAACSNGALLRVRYHWSAPVVSVRAGHYHSAAVDVGGRLYTWGWGVHGQLGLGNIDDQHTPQVVTKLQGRKVLSVGCGACHTVVLMKNGEVWACGAGVFGQLGGGSREKSSVPVRILLPEPVEMIAVGYFHTLALTSKGQLYTWGASPQQVRAEHARRSSSPGAEQVPSHHEPHLAPHPLDLSNVRGRIVQMSAGWHHSCIITNVGTMYSWGLNFDGQLGSGDRKQIPIPTEVKMRSESQPDNGKNSCMRTAEECKDMTTSALMACGGDFTIYIDDDGKVFATGNMHLPVTNEKEKGNNRMIMMKTTKRVIKIPASKTNNKFLFQPIDRVDIMFPFDIDDLQRKPIEPRLNPLTSIEDFQKKSWADDIILLLKTWINEENLTGNLNMSAKLAYHNKSYSECLRLLLDNLKSSPQVEQKYLAHTQVDDQQLITETSPKKHESKGVISNIISKRIKDVSLTILNEETYPLIDPSTYQALPCCCDELKYLSSDTPQSVIGVSEQNMSVRAANLIDKCISIFPVDSDLWETCFRLSKDFFLENGLAVSELEIVLRKYMESNATTMAAAIMYSEDCAQYNKILSPKFYLNMCSQVLDTWG